MFENSLNGIFPLIFSETEGHAEMARAFKPVFHKPTSAGFCNHSQVWGNSNSLNLGVQEGDEVFIQRTLTPKPGSSDPKYVTMSVPGGTTHTYIFPAMLDHGTIVAAIHNISPGLAVKGAGFLSIANGKVSPHGQSVSLKIGVHADDQFYLSRQFESLDID